MKDVTCYCTGHRHSRNVLGAFAAGAGLAVAPPATLRDGAVAVYGILRGTGDLLKTAQAAGREWFYLDNGYLRPGHYSGFFRVTRNAYQYTAELKPDLDRWKALGLEIRPWQPGRHVLVCPPSSVFFEHLGLNRTDWILMVTQTLARHTDREIRFRVKPRKGEPERLLADDLRDCHAVVAFQSNVAVEALIAGVPVFTGPISAASPMSGSRLVEIERPHYPDNRLEWAATLAANQWTLDEMRAGVTARALGIA